MPGAAVDHFAFFDALGSIVGRAERVGLAPEDAERLAEYRVLIAGLLTVRLVDRWVAAVKSGSTPGLRELQAARRAIHECDVGPVRNALDALTRATLDSWGTPSSDVGVKAFAYARLLQDEQAWAIAADVYLSVVACAETASDAGLVPVAYLHRGSCLRSAGLLVEADQAYTRAGAAASVVQDDYHALLSRIGAANVIANRGNLPRAEALLDAVVRDTQVLVQRNPVLIEVLARAKHDRGAVFCERGDAEKGIADFFDAFEAYTEPKRRTRVLMDLATALTLLGARGAARDALYICLAGPIDRDTRWLVTINLLDLAQQDGEETVFERWRRELADVDLPPRARAYFLLYSGQGLYRFGRVDAARTALAGALVVAERHQLNEVVIRADEALTAIDRNERLPATPVTTPSRGAAGVARVVDRLQTIRATI